MADARIEELTLLRGFAEADAILETVDALARVSPFRHMMTPGGFAMSVATTSSGAFGWVTDRAGYRYEAVDPVTSAPWPAMPDAFRALAQSAAAAAGFGGFEPDSCLVNRYDPKARMGLHQDKDEKDFTQPIVSVSLGLPAVFLWGGDTRRERPMKVDLAHGDVVVWGGAARLRFHGVAPLKAGTVPYRVNLTFRRAR